jgi:squalene-associated FAD-dependent desaturase
MKHVAVIGGGWAGCAAALSLAEAGVQVTLYEACNTLGGRARAVEMNGLILDNGQHILLGAYDQTLELIASVTPQTTHTPPEMATLLRSRLVLEQPPIFKLECPNLPAPFHLLAGLFNARGLGWMDKFAAIRWANQAINSGARSDTSVARLISDQPERVRKALWQPLCLSALNTHPDQASAETFKYVLKTAFGKSRCHSDLLFPRIDLSSLFPQPAAQRVIEQGGDIRLRTRVKEIRCHADGVAVITQHDSSQYDSLIFAVAPYHLSKLCTAIPELSGIIQHIEAYDYEAIATGYLQYPDSIRLPRPMLALSGEPAQFAFDRGQTHGQAGLIAVVVSAASRLLGKTQSSWLLLAEQQLASIATLPPPLWRKTIVEKQATYTCRPNMRRPDNITPHPRLFIAGDYTTGSYPATLESATMSGVKSAHALLNTL